MIRARFYCTGGDPRPASWPIRHPYWCTGYRVKDSAAVVVAYADHIEEVRHLWPDAVEIESESVEAYEFSDRFPRPEWFNEGENT